MRIYAPFDSPPPLESDPLLRPDPDIKVCGTETAAALLEVSLSTLRGWQKKQIGPQPIKLGNGRVVYSVEEVLSFREELAKLKRGFARGVRPTLH